MKKMIRLFDIFAGFFLLFCLCPFMALGMIWSALCIGMPPVYVSQRRGSCGRLFRHFKIRTMRAGRQIGRAYMEKERIPLSGKILRKYHIDELPELLLVLSGKMSFVGPRPLPDKFLSNFDTRLRDTVPPGLTCLAQIKLARKGFIAGPEQIFLDNMYIKKRSLSYNIKILCATIGILVYPGKPVSDENYNEYRRTLLQ